MIIICMIKYMKTTNKIIVYFFSRNGLQNYLLVNKIYNI
jgi:hypothetical protein